MGIFDDILLGHRGQVLLGIQFDPAGLLQQCIGTGRIGRVIGNGYRIPVSHLIQTRS